MGKKATVYANVPSGAAWKGWQCDLPGGADAVLSDPKAEVTSIRMPDADVELTAIYEMDKGPQGSEGPSFSMMPPASGSPLSSGSPWESMAPPAVTEPPQGDSAGDDKKPQASEGPSFSMMPPASGSPLSSGSPWESMTPSMTPSASATPPAVTKPPQSDSYGDDDDEYSSTGGSGSNKREKSTFRKKKVKIKSVRSKGKRRIQVRWKRISSAFAYQLQYSPKASMKKKKSWRTYGTSMTLGVPKKRRYYFRVRAYKHIGGSTVYTKWSRKKSVRAR